MITCRSKLRFSSLLNLIAMSSASPDPSGSEEQFLDPDLSSLGDAPQELLEQVLNETLAGADNLSGGEMARLREVVSRFQGQPVDDVAVAALVEAMVRLKFSHLSDSDAFWTTMANWIARTLCDDPESKSRIEALWNGLTEKR